MKLNDLKDLKSIRKNFDPKPEAGISDRSPDAAKDFVPGGKSAARTSGKDGRCGKKAGERPAGGDGLRIGQKVHLMDTSDTATIVGFGKGHYELELDGIVIRACRSEFTPVDPEEERRLRASMPSKRSKVIEDVRTEDPTAELTVDLHIGRIPGSDGIPEWAALDFQLNYFRQILRQNLRHRGKRIVFIHGVGDGILASAVRKELDEVFAVSCAYTFGPMGVTNVTIR